MPTAPGPHNHSPLPELRPRADGHRQCADCGRIVYSELKLAAAAIIPFQRGIVLIKRGIEIHGAIVFFSLIGGIAMFGAIGLMIGPLAVSLFLTVLRMYHRDYTPGDSRVPAVPGLPGGTEEPAAADPS